MLAAVVCLQFAWLNLQCGIPQAVLQTQVKARGKPADDDVSIAAHLLRLTDPVSNQPLPDDLLAGEFGLFFSAGIESAGNAISWTL